jgi:hypothetical protein
MLFEKLAISSKIRSLVREQRAVQPTTRGSCAGLH